MSIVVKAPNLPSKAEYKKFKIFLAGSIEMGKASPWQKEIQDLLSDLDILIFNPRRDDWDSSWEQSINNFQFKEQVEWEMEHIQGSDLVLFYFDPNTKSPITLFELGLVSQGWCVVYCPEGFWRKGNVEVICDNFGHQLFIDKNLFKKSLRDMILNVLERRKQNVRV